MVTTDLNKAYIEAVLKVFKQGHVASRRNGQCITYPGLSLSYMVGPSFPILTGRKIHYKGVFGEMAAFVRGPKSVEDFKKWGCNYWDKFGDKDGKLELDYGNAWREPIDQLAAAIEDCKGNQQSRRIIINGWRPERLEELTLPCCHFAYQFIVIGATLHLVWYQRSADMMVGIPSDMVLANLLLIGVAHASSLVAGTVTMHLGDAHIYEQHLTDTDLFIGSNYDEYSGEVFAPDCNFSYILKDFNLLEFTPDMIEIQDYQCNNTPTHFDLVL